MHILFLYCTFEMRVFYCVFYQGAVDVCGVPSIVSQSMGVQVHGVMQGRRVDVRLKS